MFCGFVMRFNGAFNTQLPRLRGKKAPIYYYLININKSLFTYYTVFTLILLLSSHTARALSTGAKVSL